MMEVSHVRTFSTEVMNNHVLHAKKFLVPTLILVGKRSPCSSGVSAWTVYKIVQIIGRCLSLEKFSRHTSSLRDFWNRG